MALARVPPIAIHYATIGRIGACGLVEVHSQRGEQSLGTQGIPQVSGA